MTPLRQHWVCPGRPRVDREARSAITRRRLTAGILDDDAGAFQVGTKCGGIQSEDALMVPAVARHFMTGFGNAADESGIALGDPARSEERRVGKECVSMCRTGGGTEH